MYLIKIIIFIFYFSSICLSNSVSYLEIVGQEKELLSNWKIETNENISIISGNTLLDYIYIETLSGSTTLWKNKRKHEDSEITAIRKKDKIIITGTKNNEPIKKEFSIGNYPWFQTPGFLLEPFARSNKESMQFIMLRITNHNPLLMEIKKDKEEKIIINDTEYLCIKTYIYPASFLKIFWKSPMWFNKKTGKILKYDGLISGPGSDSFQITYSNKKKK
jgi:hypothetical protein